MSLPYPYITDNQYHVNTASYLDQKETEMLVSGYAPDLWYGFGETDVIEMSVFDLDQNQIGWKTINSEKHFKTITLSYLDALDRPIDYSYQQLVTDFILYKNTKVLFSPADQLQKEFSIQSGSYLLSYNFMREMAGSPTAPLVVQEISPSRKEIKLIPTGPNTPRYQAFCLKKFQIKDVAPLLLSLTNQCPYDQIYSRIKDKYSAQIEYLKQLLFLTSDGAFVAFLKTLYEDKVVYTNPTSQSDPIERVKRIQGIKSYYQNLLLSNYESISDFIAIDDSYDAYAAIRVEQQFKPYGPNQGTELTKAKQFLVDFFTVEFYHPITLSAKASFDLKYYSYFKNALNTGNNTLFTIIDHAYLDERVAETDPLTLIIKLKSELPDDVKLQTACWISNISIAPYVVNAIVRKSTGIQTLKISPPNFSADSSDISLYNTNEEFTATDLRDTVADQQTIDINKKINDLKVDYTDFSNFIVFSSAQQRLVNFKNKITSWYQLSASLETLEISSSQSLAAGTFYPQYTLEKNTIEGQMTNIVDSFDGYESYLFQSGSYTFDVTARAFTNANYVSNQDYTASLYDKANRDSLVNNTPDHIVLDDENDEYLMFLNMVGHYFDNIYLYITNLPSEKTVSEDPALTFSKKMVDYMLESFGWDVGTTYEDMTTLDTYTTASATVSAENRTKAVRTRILSSLSQIYKTKGTEEAINLLLSCHGIPANLLNIREYGNDTYTTASLVTYTKNERICMFHWSGSGGAASFITQDFAPKPNIRTVELKMLFKNPELYPEKKRFQFIESTHPYTVKWDNNWTVHRLYPRLVPYYNSIQTYGRVVLPAWRLGFVREYGNVGRIWAEIPTISSSVYTSAYTGYFSGSFFGTAATASGVVSNVGVLSSSYFSGSVDGGSIFEISGSVSGALDGIITGSLQTFSWINFVGGLTGSLGDFSYGTWLQTGEVRKSSTVGGKIAYNGIPTTYLTSSLLPLFDGDIFNIRLRRNEPEAAYQYVTDTELLPSIYDLTVQRNERGRRVFRSYNAVQGTYEDNMVWDGRSVLDTWEETGSLGTTPSCSLAFGVDSDFLYGDPDPINLAFGNAMVWDAPVSDDDFEIHCNDYSSFAYSGSDAEKHLITRMEYDEPVDFLTSYYAYDYLDSDGNPLPGYSYGDAGGAIENRSEYYSTFDALYTTVVASGSWTGAKTGSLYTIEKFTGSFKGTMSGSLSGSGHGYFLTGSTYGTAISSWLWGRISGSMSGSFNGDASGSISSSYFSQKGRFGAGYWKGESYSADNVTRSLFTGFFSGSATGSFAHSTIMYGDMTSSLGQAGSWTGGVFHGHRLGGWTGSFTGSLTGSMKLIYASGSFSGSISGSLHHIPSIGTFNGTTNQIWYGTLTGSLTGSFTGSTGEVVFTGSSPYYSYQSQAMFSGSFKGSMTSSVNDNLVPRDYYATGSFSGSFFQIWTGSRHILYNKPIMPSNISYGSYHYWRPLHATQSVYVYCNDGYQFVTYYPVFPYEFLVKDIEKTYTTPSYGPNRFRNEKVKPMKQGVAARLDDEERSTKTLATGVQADSNLLGLYLDPQDAKNRDIVKYVGNNNLVDLIAEPSNMYSASYEALEEVNQQYNSFGNRQVLYNELITLYKVYFSREVFDAVKNVIPARASVRTGILVEPTVLERPKYQHRPIAPEMNTGSVAYYDVTASHYFRDPITKLMRFSGSTDNTSNGTFGLLFGEFNTSGVSSQSLDYTTLPSNPTIHLDLGYLNEANFNYPINWNNGYYCDLPDSLQFGNFGSLGGAGGYPEAVGYTVQEDLDAHTNNGGEDAAFLVKRWDRHTIYFKSGSYIRTSDRNADLQTTNSIWLYTLVGMSPEGYQKIFYTGTTLEASASLANIAFPDDVVIIGPITYYTHRANTAVGTPNQRVNVIRAADNHVSYPYVVASGSYFSIVDKTYFEVFGGYPRNHYTHKRMQFSPMKFNSLNGRYKVQTAQIYIRGSQTVNTTIDDQSGLEDASLPVQTIQTSNVNLQQSDNVINQ